MFTVALALIYLVQLRYRVILLCLAENPVSQHYKPETAAIFPLSLSSYWTSFSSSSRDSKSPYGKELLESESESSDGGRKYF